MKLYIKNMVCNRCKTTVRTELDKIGIAYTTIRIGEVCTEEKVSPEKLEQLSEALQKSGFELIDTKNNMLIEKLKKSVIDLEHYSDEDLKTSFSDYIRLIVDDNFISLNKLFEEIEGITIEKYINKRKIERIKEILVYEDLGLAEIAKKMHYTSAIALSAQFKRMTGLTPAYFRQLRQNRTLNSTIS